MTNIIKFNSSEFDSAAAVGRAGAVEQMEVVEQAVRTLKAGGLIIFPTETVYGAGVDATNQAAVDKLLAYKTRREGKPLSIAVADEQMAAEYAEINPQAQRLYRRFLPGPVTVISTGRHRLAQGVESEFGSLGVRIPDYPLVVEIVRRLGRPITATSANASGRKRPYVLADVFDHLSAAQRRLVDLAIDAGRLPNRPPSTVIDTTLSTPTTVRAGNFQLVDGGRPQNLVKLTSQTETETKQLAGKLLLQHWDQIKKHGLVIGLDGPLGAGKTIFAKGLAEFLRLDEPITSPTYSYIEEYPYQRHGVEGKFYHLDLWKIANQAEVEKLAIEQLITPHNLVAIEWWQPLTAILSPMVAAADAKLIRVKINPHPTGTADHRQQTRELEILSN